MFSDSLDDAVCDRQKELATLNDPAFSEES